MVQKTEEGIEAKLPCLKKLWPPYPSYKYYLPIARFKPERSNIDIAKIIEVHIKCSKIVKVFKL
jgi:hypothetical protein